MKTIPISPTLNCWGDKLHNETVDMLYKDVDKRTSTFKRLAPIIYKHYFESKLRNNQSFVWCIHWLSKTDARDLNAAMKSKTEKTFQKRILNFMRKKLRKYYGFILEKELLLDLEKMIKLEVFV